MSQLDPARLTDNRLLSALERADGSARLGVERVELGPNQVLEAPGATIQHVYFIENGLGSVVAGPHKAVEIGMFGRNGMSGVAVILGAEASPYKTVTRIPGSALRMRAEDLHRLMRDRPAVRELLLRYVQTFTVQVAETALTRVRDPLARRLARWLLMADDETGDEAIQLTHEVLSSLLGVRRAGVTLALHELEGEKIIRATRNRIAILDRGMLEAAVGDSYGVPEAEFARLIRFGQSGRGNRPWGSPAADGLAEPRQAPRRIGGTDTMTTS